MSASESHWQLSRPTIRERSKYLFNSDLLSDVTFRVSRRLEVCNSQSESTMLIPAHKLLLSISSPVFFAMFYGELADTSGTIDLPECDYESVLELFRFIYSDEVNLTGGNVMQVLYLAKKYLVPSLTGRCVDYLQNSLDTSNVFSILPSAMKLEEKRLLERCWEVIDGQTAEAVSSDEFVTLERPLVESVVQRNSLNVKEVDLFKAVDLWATKECERQELLADGHTKRSLLGEDILHAVRFPLMTQKEFAAVVPDSGMLTATEMGDMIKHFNDVLASPLQFERARRTGVSRDIRRCGRFRSVSPPNPIQGWSYSRGLPDFIAFHSDRVIDLLGVRVFGTEESEYSYTLQVKRDSSVLVKMSGSYFSDKSEADGHYGFDVLFDRPVRLEAGVIYTVEALISGPYSWFGEQGKDRVECSGVTFSFSSLRNADTNGTNLRIGQFPYILF